MRSKLFILSLLGVFLSPTGFAQNTIGGPRAASPAPAAMALPSASETSTAGILVPSDSKLSPGDLVSVKILEDNEEAWKSVISDTGEVELSALGSVSVANRTAAEAGAIIGAYLRKDYYHKATVDLKILRKSVVRPDKASVAGKVQRAGPQYFTDAAPLKLSEAVIVAGTTAFSNLEKVQLTRRGQNTIYNVDAIIKKGRTDLDVRLENGDQVFIPERGIVFGAN